MKVSEVQNNMGLNFIVWTLRHFSKQVNYLEIILICRFVAQGTFLIIINVEKQLKNIELFNIFVETNKKD